MNFDFNLFSTEKQKAFGRLNRGKNFCETKIELQNIEIDQDKKKNGEIINKSTIII